MGCTSYYHEPGNIPAFDPSINYPPDVIKKNIGKRIQQRLYELGWRQTELANRAGLGRDSISLYIRGKNTPGPRNLKLVSDALGVTVQDLAPELQTATKNRQGDFGPQHCSQTSDGFWHIRIDRVVDQKTMLKILKALDKYENEATNVALASRAEPESSPSA